MLRFGLIFAGSFIAASVAVLITGRAMWVHRTYGADLGFVDRVEAVMTPVLWIWAGIAVLLIGLGAGSAS